MVIDELPEDEGKGKPGKYTPGPNGPTVRKERNKKALYLIIGGIVLVFAIAAVLV